jgi:hypothetical protein
MCWATSEQITQRKLTPDQAESNEIIDSVV